MNDIRKLLAGYATGTLTEAERKALFEAALTDDDLFAALSDEEPLRQLLSDSAARSELLARIQPAAPDFRERFAAWLQRPAVMAGFVTAAAAVLVIAVVPLFREPSPKQIAQVQPPVAAPPQMTAPAQVTSTRQREPKQISRTTTAAPRSLKKQQAQSAPEETTSAPPPPLALAEAPRPPAQAVPAPAAAGAISSEAVQLRSDATTHFVATSDAASPETTTQHVVILKKDLSGSYVPIDPATTMLSQGDTVRLRVNSAESSIVRIQGATPQPIVQNLAAGGNFETGDILVGAQDMRLLVNFGVGIPAARSVVSSMRSAQTARAKSVQPVEIILRVKKP